MAISEKDRQELLALVKDGSLANVCGRSSVELERVIVNGNEDEILQILKQAELAQIAQRLRKMAKKLRSGDV